MSTPKKRKSKKHPKDMTTDEAIKHIFHPKIVKHLKHHAANESKREERKHDA